MSKPSVKYIPSVYALLEKDRAVDLWSQASDQSTSKNPIVRAVIDQGLGFLCLGTGRPQDDIQARVIKIETEGLARAREALAKLPGVRRVGDSFAEVTCG